MVWFCCVCVCVVDTLLDPDNRLHMTTENQLRELLDKLDVVTSMRSSGARTRRIRLLRREINNVRYKQHSRNSHMLNGDLKEEDEEEDEDKEMDGEHNLSSSSSDKGKTWLGIENWVFRIQFLSSYYSRILLLFFFFF